MKKKETKKPGKPAPKGTELKIISHGEAPGRGRPSKYNPDVAKRICDAIAVSELGLHHICRENADFPSIITIMAWLNRPEHVDFLKSYVRARELQAEFMAEQILKIADDSSEDLMAIGMPGQERKVENREVTNRSKLRVDTRKWLLAKLHPKKYGDKVELDHTSGGKPIIPSWMQQELPPAEEPIQQIE